MAKDTNHTVWSSENGDVRKKAKKSVDVKSLPPHQQTVYLHRESKGRGGKAVTLVKNLVLNVSGGVEYFNLLKQVCGSGGTVKDSLIEIQGEHREKIATVLEKMDYKVKIAGG